MRSGSMTPGWSGDGEVESGQQRLLFNGSPHLMGGQLKTISALHVTCDTKHRHPARLPGLPCALHHSP